MTDADKVEVTQEDREAAWGHRPSCYTVDDYTDWAAGKYDFSATIIKSFTRHRLASVAAATAEKDAEIARLKAAIERQASAVRSLHANEQREINILRAGRKAAHVAVSTLDSEREANAILTTERDQLRAKLDEAVVLLKQIKESDEASIREMAAMGIELPDSSGAFAREISSFLSSTPASEEAQS